MLHGELKFICILISIIFLLNIVLGQPPGLPVQVYGKVLVEGTKRGVGGLDVSASWTDASGAIKTSKTKTLTIDEANDINHPELVGYYHFSENDILAQEGAVIKISASSEYVEVESKEGLIIEAPALFVKLKDMSSGNVGFIERIKQLFSNEEDETDEQKDYSGTEEDNEQNNLYTNQTKNETIENITRLVEKINNNPLTNKTGHAPILESIDSFELACENTVFSKIIAASDIDKGRLEFYVDPKEIFSVGRTEIINSTMSFSRLSSRKLNKSMKGRHELQLYVSDGQYIDTKNVIIDVIEINNAPTLEDIDLKTIEVGKDKLYLSINAWDVEDNNLDYDIYFKNKKRLFELRKNIINYTPSLSDIGAYIIEYCVIDKGINNRHVNISFCDNGPERKRICNNFSLTVTEKNQAPAIQINSPQLKNLILNESTYSNFNISVIDNDGTVPQIKWYIDGEEQMLSEDRLQSNLHASFECGENKMHNVKVEAYDGLNVSSSEWKVLVNISDCERLNEKKKSLIEFNRKSFIRLWLFFLNIFLIGLFIILFLKFLKYIKDVRKERETSQINANENNFNPLPLFFIFFLILVIPVGVADSPPEIPIIVYGKVLFNDGSPAEEIPVIALWQGKDGTLRNRITRTINYDEASKSGFPNLAGYYRFIGEDIIAPEGTVIEIESMGANISIEARNGALIAAEPIIVQQIKFNATEVIPLNTSYFFTKVAKYLTKLFKIEGESKGGINPANYGIYGENNAEEMGGQGGIKMPPVVPGSIQNEKSVSGDDLNNSTLFRNFSYIENNDSIESLEEETNYTIGEIDNAFLKIETYNENQNDKTPINYTLYWNKGTSNVFKSFSNVYTGFIKQDNTVKLYEYLVFFGLIFIIFILIVRKKLIKILKNKEDDIERRIGGYGGAYLSKLISKDFPALDPKNNVYDAVELFFENQINVIPVISEDYIVGVIEKRDILFGLDNYSYDKLHSKLVRDIMKHDYGWIDEKTGLNEVYKKILDEKRDYLIVKRKSKVTGIITLMDLLRAIGQLNFEIENPPLLRTIMREDFLRIDSDNALSELKKIFKNKDNDFAVVYSGEDAKGIITYKDILSAIHKNTNFEKIKISTLISPNIVTLTPGNTLNDSIKICLERGFNQIPITLNNEIVGYVDLKGIVAGYHYFLQDLEKNVKSGNFRKFMKEVNKK